MDEDAILDIIKSRKDGILQNALWKVAGIDSRKCSRIVKKLLDKNLITRESAVSGGSRTYLIKVVEEVVPEKLWEDSRRYLISNGLFSVCTGCTLECAPEYCEFLTEWIFNLLAEEELQEEDTE
jgi:DNA-binding MarR family transcriptional regulator